jgi:hypothetical protein
VCVDKKLGNEKISKLCKSFTDSAKISDNPVEEEEHFEKCNRQLKKEWLTLYPVAPCLVDFNGFRSFLFLSKMVKLPITTQK